MLLRYCAGFNTCRFRMFFTVYGRFRPPDPQGCAQLLATEITPIIFIPTPLLSFLVTFYFFFHALMQALFIYFFLDL
ncbi:hypothetical protein K501DRAFT_60287 [Backusella circina FSU 941]|nr:hypothetical protein K501DRAFT_60287 [Backusella circina FSU 941]